MSLDTYGTRDIRWYDSCAPDELWPGENEEQDGLSEDDEEPEINEREAK